MTRTLDLDLDQLPLDVFEVTGSPVVSLDQGPAADGTPDSCCSCVFTCVIIYQNDEPGFLEDVG